MPITIATSELVSGVSLGIQHGAYPFNLRGFSKLKDGILKTPGQKTHVIVWFKAGNDRYPKLPEVKANAFSPNGGVQRACDAKLGTFGVYEISTAKPEAGLVYWVDFDHWPVEMDATKEEWVMIKDLNNGHKHVKAKGLGKQLPAEAEDRTLYTELLKVV
jgi:hypothetical protein